LGDFERALAQYQALLEQNDRSAEVHNNLGLLYQEHGDTQQAIGQFRKAIAIAPRHAKAHNNLGVAELQLGDFEAAAAELRVALKQNPTTSSPWSTSLWSTRVQDGWPMRESFSATPSKSTLGTRAHGTTSPLLPTNKETLPLPFSTIVRS